MKASLYFLLYVGVMLITTFLQQEFVLIPELQNFDLVGDEARAQMLEKWQKWRWLSFVAAPILLLLRLSLVSLCLFVGSFFSAEMAGRKFRDWWGVAMKAQAVMILYSVVLCVVNVTSGANEAQTLTNCTSLLLFSALGHPRFTFSGGRKRCRIALAAHRPFLEERSWSLRTEEACRSTGTYFWRFPVPGQA